MPFGWLLPLNLLLLTLVFRRRGRWSLAEAYFFATVALGAALAVFTEVLSIGRALTPEAALAVQGGLALGLLFALLRPWPRRLPRLSLRLDASTWLSWSLPAVVLGVTGYLAWISPPNTVDSWTYHLPRVLHWVQDRSVAPYPTHVIHQIYQMPWSEEAILWLRLLTGGDRYAAFVQWWALFSLMVVLPDFVRLLVPQVSPVWPRWIAVTVPVAILQASSTRNDLMAAYWAVGFVYALLAYRRTRALTWLAGGALALGLALRTKGTAYLWLFPFGLWWLGIMLRRRAWRGVALATLLGGVLLIGPWYRNFIVFGHPLGSREVRQFYIIQRPTVRGWLSNSLRQLASHATAGYPYLRLPYKYRRLFRTEIEHAVVWTHEHVLHLSPSDSRYTKSGHWFHIPRRRFPSEDESGAFTHVVLLLLVTPWLLWKGSPLLRGYTAVFWADWALFVALEKWEVWVPRYHLPWLMLGVPLLAWAFQRLTEKRPWVGGLALLGLFLLVPRPLLDNLSRPLYAPVRISTLSPMERMFLPEEGWRQPYLEAMHRLGDARQCQQVGLLLDKDGPEYLFWYLLAPQKSHLRMEHVLVTNETARFAALWPPFDPCAVIVTRPDFVATETWQVLGHTYRLIFDDPKIPLFVYLADDGQAALP